LFLVAFPKFMDPQPRLLAEGLSIPSRSFSFTPESAQAVQPPISYSFRFLRAPPCIFWLQFRSRSSFLLAAIRGLNLVLPRRRLRGFFSPFQYSTQSRPGAIPHYPCLTARFCLSHPSFPRSECFPFTIHFLLE